MGPYRGACTSATGPSAQARPAAPERCIPRSGNRGLPEHRRGIDHEIERATGPGHGRRGGPTGWVSWLPGPLLRRRGRSFRRRGRPLRRRGRHFLVLRVLRVGPGRMARDADVLRQHAVDGVAGDLLLLRGLLLRVGEGLGQLGMGTAGAVAGLAGDAGEVPIRCGLEARGLAVPGDVALEAGGVGPILRGQDCEGIGMLLLLLPPVRELDEVAGGALGGTDVGLIGGRGRFLRAGQMLLLRLGARQRRREEEHAGPGEEPRPFCNECSSHGCRSWWWQSPR